MDDIYKNIEENSPNKKRKMLIVFHDMIADMLSNKNLSPVKTELCIRDRKLNISLDFITQPYLAVPKSIRLNSEADSRLVKLVVMTNIFFNNQQHETKIKLLRCVKQIKSSFLSKS